jgi:hypothetical protein
MLAASEQEEVIVHPQISGSAPVGPLGVSKPTPEKLAMVSDFRQAEVSLALR